MLPCMSTHMMTISHMCQKLSVMAAEAEDFDDSESVHLVEDSSRVEVGLVYELK